MIVTSTQIRDGILHVHANGKRVGVVRRGYAEDTIRGRRVLWFPVSIRGGRPSLPYESVDDAVEWVVSQVGTFAAKV
jgi:hypothetical protein